MSKITREQKIQDLVRRIALTSVELLADRRMTKLRSAELRRLLDALDAVLQETP